MKLVTEDGKEKKMAYTPQAFKLTKKIDNFDIEAFEKWFIENKCYIGGMMIAEFLFKGENKKKVMFP